MPTDKSGKYHMNTQRANAADRAPAPAKEAPMKESGGGEPGGEGHIGHHLMQQAADHPSGGKHMHVHQGDDGAITSHHVGHDGEVQGPHSHENMEALKQHMSQFFDEEGHEGGAPEMAMHHGGGSLHGM